MIKKSNNNNRRSSNNDNKQKMQKKKTKKKQSWSKCTVVLKIQQIEVDRKKSYTYSGIGI